MQLPDHLRLGTSCGIFLTAWTITGDLLIHTKTGRLYSHLPGTKVCHVWRSGRLAKDLVPSLDDVAIGASALLCSSHPDMGSSILILDLPSLAERHQVLAPTATGMRAPHAEPFAARWRAWSPSEDHFAIAWISKSAAHRRVLLRVYSASNAYLEGETTLPWAAASDCTDFQWISMAAASSQCVQVTPRRVHPKHASSLAKARSSAHWVSSTKESAYRLLESSWHVLALGL